MGTLGCFSFYPRKNLGSLGEGGAVTGTDPELIQTVRQLRDHGQSHKYVHRIEGFNGRLHAIQAAFLRIKLRCSAERNARRRVADFYRESLVDVGEIVLPIEAAYAKHVYHLFVIRTEQRDELREHLGKHGIDTGLHYPIPLHLQNAYTWLGLKEGSLPVTERVAHTCLSLPMFPQMTEGQVDRVSSAIRAFFGC